MPTYLTKPISRTESETFARKGYRCGFKNNSENADYLLPEDSERLRKLIEERIGTSRDDQPDQSKTER